jgi:hypothetical protein
MRILLALGTGLRLGDIESIRVSDIDFENRSVTTRSKKTRKSMGSRPVPVPIMAELKKYVSGLDAEQEKIFNDNFSRIGLTIRCSKIPTYCTIRSYKYPENALTNQLTNRSGKRLKEVQSMPRDIRLEITRSYVHIFEKITNFPKKDNFSCYKALMILATKLGSFYLLSDRRTYNSSTAIFFNWTMVVTLAIIDEFGILIGWMLGAESEKRRGKTKSSQAKYKF